MNRYLKPIIGAIIGAALAGGWLVVDLLLPEPIGDYLLFILMGITNMVIGWQVARLVEKTRENRNANNSSVKGLENNSNLNPGTIANREV